MYYKISWAVFKKLKINFVYLNSIPSYLYLHFLWIVCKLHPKNDLFPSILSCLNLLERIGQKPDVKICVFFALIPPNQGIFTPRKV